MNEFCEHLDEYGVLFGRAQASYESCLNIMDKMIEAPGNKELSRTLEKGLDEWVLETRNLRSLFTKLVKDGSIKLPSSLPVETSPDPEPDPEPKTPSCRNCGFQVPKLVFPEFLRENDGQMKYRGELLPLPTAAEV